MTFQSSHEASELVIGLVGAVGSDLELVSNAVRSALAHVGYEAQEIHLIELLHQIERWRVVPESPLDERYHRHMDAGNEFRQATSRGDALALLAVGAVREERKDTSDDPNVPIPRRAYILRSLKHPAEVSTLRRIYGPSFVLVAAYAPREIRRQALAKQISDSHQSFHVDEHLSKADEIMRRDEAEAGKPLGQSVRKTFPLADVFINAAYPNGLQQEVTRFVELLFGNTFHTPTRDEYAMFHAQAAALRSAALSRQVGAVIATEDGDLIAVGTNEVPKSGGGLYWAGDSPDYRDFRLGFDTSDEFRRKLIGDVLKRLREGGWLAEEKRGADIENLIEQALTGTPYPMLADAPVMDVIEFVRAVHAEMAALVDAARRGVAVHGSRLYTTTFPCHDCAKHLVGAGIQRVVYIEPYPKSLVPELYPDQIVVDPPAPVTDRVSFTPFVGVAPRRYLDLFTMVERKQRDGKIIDWPPVQPKPRLGEESPSYLARLVAEEEEFVHFSRQMLAQGLITSRQMEGEHA